ncbi:histidinol-phosphatase HisJ family protein [Anaerocolumna sedimenticola]|uniref:Histidinol-phosphatase n=1 Tax=Anaerocolumna sedimenticola TaxID=2696063 RepID=A0A6P1TLW0_9FIRM|nr:histidinol-phosphatase HisJ family protein [Anaerocolumna sedimenticola]QHQ62024.1 histidinol-phosphatase HisJ family protein [Anaerocolumna sedimenticola]
MIIADYHVHSSFSSDSTAPMEDMIEKAISLGMSKICFTDHMDYDFPNTNGLPFIFNPEEYFTKLADMTGHYKSKIKVLKGIELGLQPYLAPRYEALIEKYDFDFAIGSSHLVNGLDPYYPEYWMNQSPEKGVEIYFQSIIDNVKAFAGFQVYGHLDYVIRYVPDKTLIQTYSYKKYGDIIDEVLRTIIQHGKGIEVNTAGYKYGLGFAHPHSDILKRYKELGGEVITIGSDGHAPEHLGYDFPKAEELLRTLGFDYYVTYENRKPIFEKLK